MTSNASRRLDAAASREDAGTAVADEMWSWRTADGTLKPGWALLPLRLFLGVTFVFAGLQKLANPDFFRSSSPISIHAQLVGASHTSPIGSLLGHLTSISTLVGVIIAVGEVAVGVGALVGLLTRVAAAGGMALSLGLFLAVSFRTNPYYSGSDIVFLFAWTPLLVVGAAGAPALDTWLADRRAAAPAAEPAGGISRRAVVSTGAIAAGVAGGVVLLSGAVAALGRMFAPSTSAANTSTTTTTTSTTTTAPTASTTTTSTTAAAPPAGTVIGSTSSVPVGGSATFTDPKTGDPGLVIQQPADTYRAFDAICPHAGCTVAYQPSAKIIVCPCHGSEFNAKTGAVELGPATTGLTPIKVVRGPNGDLYAI